MASCCWRRASSNAVDESVSTTRRTANTNPPPIVITKEGCITGVILVILSPFIAIGGIQLANLLFGPFTDPWPTFILESVSVSLNDVPDNPSQMNVEWNIGFYVEYEKTSADFRVNVQSMLRNSTTFALSGNGLIWKETKGGSNGTRANATVNSLLPRFNTTNAGLEFDMNFWASGNAGYSEFSYMCEGVKLGFSPNGNSGLMLGKRVECVSIEYL